MKNTKMNSAQMSPAISRHRETIKRLHERKKVIESTHEEPPLTRLQCILEEVGAWLLLGTAVGFMIYLISVIA